jgi:hypothetical protein
MGRGALGALRPGGGGGMNYQSYLRSPWWRWLVRPLRLALDGHRCATCHGRRRLQVHHASYKHRGAWQFWLEVADTITLCDACHEGVHSRQPIKEFAD